MYIKIQDVRHILYILKELDLGVEWTYNFIPSCFSYKQNSGPKVLLAVMYWVQMVRNLLLCSGCKWYVTCCCVLGANGT